MFINENVDEDKATKLRNSMQVQITIGHVRGGRFKVKNEIDDTNGIILQNEAITQPRQRGAQYVNQPPTIIVEQGCCISSLGRYPICVLASTMTSGVHVEGGGGGGGGGRKGYQSYCTVWYEQTLRVCGCPIKGAHVHVTWVAESMHYQCALGSRFCFQA